MTTRPAAAGAPPAPGAAGALPPAEGTGDEPGLLVHGMGTDLVPPTWPPLTAGEVAAVVARYLSGTPVVRWRSPRPMSAAALVEVAGEQIFVKRHHRAVRSADQLRVEHAFAAHLRRHGQDVPEVLVAAGDTVVSVDDAVYEVHRAAAGLDLYRDVPSWHPYACPDHAREAGRALAHFHRAAGGFSAPARPAAVLTNSMALVAAPDPGTALAGLLARRPSLARALAGRPVHHEVIGAQRRRLQVVGPLLRALPTRWGHGDWHPSNLTWSGPGPGATVVEVLDLGLANRTTAVHDVAVAIERAGVDWLDLARRGQVGADLPAVAALVDGYQEVRPLTAAEARTLVALLPVVHLEYALSEVEYFAEVVRAEADAELAYTDYLVGHARWFGQPAGAELLELLQANLRLPTGPD